MVVGVVVVAVAAADCDDGGDGHLYVTVVLVDVKFYLVYTWYQVKGFCANAPHFTVKAIYQDYSTIIGLLLFHLPSDNVQRLYQSYHPSINYKSN